jgi:hypothetical protein
MCGFVRIVQPDHCAHYLLINLPLLYGISTQHNYLVIHDQLCVKHTISIILEKYFEIWLEEGFTHMVWKFKERKEVIKILVIPQVHFRIIFSWFLQCFWGAKKYSDAQNCHWIWGVTSQWSNIFGEHLMKQINTMEASFETISRELKHFKQGFQF